MVYEEVIEFVYLLKFKNLNSFKQNDKFIIEEEGIKHLFYWCPLDKTKDLKVYPSIINKNIKNLSDEIKHITENDQ